MQSSFPALHIRLMVGIAGGAPSDKHDIRLGDVVVSSPTPRHGGVIHYDFGKAVQNHEFEITSHMAPPPGYLLNAIGHLKAEHKRAGHRITETIGHILKKNPRLTVECSRPNEGDRLYNAEYDHSDQEECDCRRLDYYQDNDSAEHQFLKLRTGRSKGGGGGDPVIHYGLIASANQLMKDAVARDILIEKDDVLCFEMEAAGLMNSFHCVVIRDICDYSDTHKNDSWQGYAAAYAKELLEIIPSRHDGSTISKLSLVFGRDVTDNYLRQC